MALQGSISQQNQSMAEKQPNGYSCRFVEKPKELQIECMICLCILKDPHLVGCCGLKFCQECIGSISRQNFPCPNCQSRQFSSMPDKQLKRQLDERIVYCSNEKRGCKWRGQLKQLTAHLDEMQTLSQNNPLVKTVCDFQDVPCPRCRDLVRRKSLQSHIINICVHRDIPCVYEYAGCRVKVRQSNMETHLQRDVKNHSQFLAEYLKRQAEELRGANRTIDDLRTEIENLKGQLSVKIDKNSKDVARIDKETKQLKMGLAFASMSTWFVRWLLLAVMALFLIAFLYINRQHMPFPDKAIFTAVFGGVIVWLFVPSCWFWK